MMASYITFEVPTTKGQGGFIEPALSKTLFGLGEGMYAYTSDLSVAACTFKVEDVNLVAFNAEISKMGIAIKDAAAPQFKTKYPESDTIINVLKRPADTTPFKANTELAVADAAVEKP